MFNTNIIYFFVGTSTDLQCDQCRKTYCSKSSLNHHKKTQHKQVVLLWKLDGEQIQTPSNPNKEEILDLELEIKQHNIFAKNSIVKELVFDLIDQVINVSEKVKCEECHSRFINFELNILAINAPEQVPRNGNFYKYLKLEQETVREFTMSSISLRFILNVSKIKQ